ncbi:phage integrase family protein [Mycobacteroides abscessus subsp. massiliense]|uniref:site-specific integrase n=1 Tax=Mycobacteroides abscessus TaxID=36809 RepID=UPI0009A88A20|nr:site-specific integrase [Mycobacteroides abscessus]SLH43665.1 phage integrase family protein [Mycobacteroides abscessus subsp. massiliense]
MAKRRGNREGTITLRANGTYQGRLRYTDPHTGDAKRISVYGKTSQEVRDKIKKVLERIEDGAPARDAKDSVGAWMQRWRETSLEASDRKATTKHLYSSLSRKHLETGDLATTRLDRLKPSDVEALIVQLRKRNLADSTVRSIYTVLRAGLDGAVRDGLLGRNPVALVPRPRVDRDEARSLGPEDVRALLDTARRSRYYVGVLIMATCGLRRGEVAALRWADIDLKKAELMVTHTLARVDGELILSRPKTKRSRRRVPISPAVITELRARRKQQNEERLRAGSMWGGHEAMVLTTELGTMVDPRNLLRVVEVAARSADISDVGAHTLRHSAATAWLESGVHIKAVADLLGHGSISITGDLYGHTTPEHAKSAVEGLAALLESNGRN